MEKLPVSQSVEELKELEEMISPELVPDGDASLVVHELDTVPDHMGIPAEEQSSAKVTIPSVQSTVPNRALSRISV